MARKHEKELLAGIRQWKENTMELDRMKDLETMQNLHRDFSDVVMHLNKFRVELSFTKLFGAMQAAKDR